MKRPPPCHRGGHIPKYQIKFKKDTSSNTYIKQITNKPLVEKTIYKYRGYLLNFASWCQKKYWVKKLPKTVEHLQDYIDFLVAEGKSPYSIYTYLAGVCHCLEVPLTSLSLPKRVSAKAVRSRGGHAVDKRADAHRAASPRLYDFAAAVGIRRAEYAALKGDDIVRDENNYLCVRVKRGKGGKYQLQRLLPQDEMYVRSFFSGKPEDYVFTKSEMENKIDLHALRQKHAWDCYTYYLDRLKSEPDYRKQLEAEMYERWQAMQEYNRKKAKEKGKTWKSKKWNPKELQGIYKLRGENRKLAKKIGRPVEYDKCALMAVSIFHLSHWRSDVTVSNYILAVKSEEKNKKCRPYTKRK